MELDSNSNGSVGGQSPTGLDILMSQGIGAINVKSTKRKKSSDSDDARKVKPKLIVAPPRSLPVLRYRPDIRRHGMLHQGRDNITIEEFTDDELRGYMLKNMHRKYRDADQDEPELVAIRERKMERRLERLHNLMDSPDTKHSLRDTVWDYRLLEEYRDLNAHNEFKLKTPIPPKDFEPQRFDRKHISKEFEGYGPYTHNQTHNTRLWNDTSLVNLEEWTDEPLECLSLAKWTLKDKVKPESLRPILQLASRLLLSPASIRFLHAYLFQERLIDERAKNIWKKDLFWVPGYADDEFDNTMQAQSEVKMTLDEAAPYIRWGLFNGSQKYSQECYGQTSADPKFNQGPLPTVVGEASYIEIGKAPFYCIAALEETLRSESHSNYNKRQLNSAILRWRWILAVTMCHELAVFGGLAETWPHSIPTPAEFRLMYFVKWPDAASWGTRFLDRSNSPILPEQYIRRLPKRSHTHYFMKMSWLAKVFSNKFWARVNRPGTPLSPNNAWKALHPDLKIGMRMYQMAPAYMLDQNWRKSQSSEKASSDSFGRVIKDPVIRAMVRRDDRAIGKKPGHPGLEELLAQRQAIVAGFRTIEEHEHTMAMAAQWPGDEDSTDMEDEAIHAQKLPILGPGWKSGKKKKSEKKPGKELKPGQYALVYSSGSDSESDDDAKSKGKGEGKGKVNVKPGQAGSSGQAEPSRGNEEEEDDSGEDSSEDEDESVAVNSQQDSSIAREEAEEQERLEKEAKSKAESDADSDFWKDVGNSSATSNSDDLEDGGVGAAFGIQVKEVLRIDREKKKGKGGSNGQVEGGQGEEGDEMVVDDGNVAGEDKDKDVDMDY
ncbi:hypothetical protein MMC25_007001 [Agyrium rufum]|nr:hypothetical protein [Agyrium rufum]